MRLHHLALVLTLGPCLHGTADAQSAAPAPAPPADIALLNKAVLGLERSKTLDAVSEMRMRASGQGMNYAYQERVHFVLQKPDKYHADVTLISPEGTPGAKYAVVCDGGRVWVYRAVTGQYAVLPRAVFEQNDLGGLGLFGSLVRSSVGDSANALVDLKDMTKSGLTTQGGTVTLKGVVCPVFAMADPKMSDTLRIALDPQAALIRQLALEGQQQGLTLDLTETVTRQSSPPDLPASLFRFTPPAGAKRVKTLAIGPF